MNVQIDSSHQSNHPSLSILQKKLEEAGFRITDADSKVVLIVGEDPSGFSTAEVQNIEGFLEERFLGAELFLLARSFPFARVRCGINDSGQLIIAFPLSNETAQHLVHLLQMYFRRKNQGHLHAIKPVVPPSIGKQPLPAAGWIDNLHRSDFHRLHQRQPLPSFILENPAAADVLRSTTAHDTATNNDTVFHLYGFPDLLRPTSKALLLSCDGGVVALHRTALTAGVITPHTEKILLDGTSVEEISEERTGSPPPQNQSLFALNQGTLYFWRGAEIVSWDGQRQRSEGSPKQVFASLLLHWSQR